MNGYGRCTVCGVHYERRADRKNACRRPECLASRGARHRIMEGKESKLHQTPEHIEERIKVYQQRAANNQPLFQE